MSFYNKSELIGKTNFEGATWEGAQIEGISNQTGAKLPGAEELMTEAEIASQKSKGIFTVFSRLFSKNKNLSKVENNIPQDLPTVENEVTNVNVEILNNNVENLTTALDDAQEEYYNKIKPSNSAEIERS